MQPKPLVLAEFLEAIKRVLATGETDLTIFRARLYNEGAHLEWKEGRQRVSMRVESLDVTIKALRAKGKAPATKRTAKRK